MHPLSPALIIAAASGIVGPDAVEEQSRAADAQSTAAFVGHIGYWGHYDEEAELSTWPFPIEADCEALAQLAGIEGVLSGAAPQPGAVFLKWSRQKQQFVRAGIVVAQIRTFGRSGTQRCYDCLVLEGSALLIPVEEADGRRRKREQFATAVQWARRTRMRCVPAEGDKFISWVDLDDRGETTRPPAVSDAADQPKCAA